MLLSEVLSSLFISRSTLEDWNPMKKDYETPSFNSYTRGPGKLLKPSPLSGEKNCVLFVTHIPVQLTRVRRNKQFQLYSYFPLI